MIKGSGRTSDLCFIRLIFVALWRRSGREVRIGGGKHTVSDWPNSAIYWKIPDDGTIY